MVDYKASLEKGLSAAQEADANRNEINSIFEEVNRELADATGGCLTLHIETMYEPMTPQQRIEALRNPFAGTQRSSYRAITARNHNSSGGEGDFENLARWKQGAAGYPCEIRLSDKRLYCEDGEGLRNSLAQMLEDPEVGEKITKIIEAK